MQISIPKTFAMHVSQKRKMKVPKESDVVAHAKKEKWAAKQKCDCGYWWSEPSVLAAHKRTCRADVMFKEKYVVKEIHDIRGSPGPHEVTGGRFFHVEWAGKWKPEEQIQWVAERDIDEQAVEDFWATRPWLQDSIVEKPGENRCVWCCKSPNKDGKFYKTAASLKSHHTRNRTQIGGCPYRPPDRANTKTAHAVVRGWLKEEEQKRPKVSVEKCFIQWVFNFKYLGALFQADGDTRHMMLVRAAIARSKFKELLSVWLDDILPLDLKLQLYKSFVTSTLCHGYEAWKFNTKNKATLRNWNAKCLSVMTGKSIHAETKDPTFDLIAHLRARRLRWLGHILRLDPQRPTRQIVMSFAKPYSEGSLLMDAPEHTSLEELSEIASDRVSWRKLVRAISSDADDKNDDDSESRASRPKGGAGLGHKYNDSKWKPTTLNAV